jgi:hypothetical protein
MKDHEHTYKLQLNNYFLQQILIWRWWDFQTTEVDAKLAPVNVRPKKCTDRYTECEQFLIRPVLWDYKYVNMAGSWKLNFTFYFIEGTHEALHLKK